jgi:hypothetical protein
VFCGEWLVELVALVALVALVVTDRTDRTDSKRGSRVPASRPVFAVAPGCWF